MMARDGAGRKNYRELVEKALDLADPTDPLELAQHMENTAQVLRFAAQIRNQHKEDEERFRLLAPWFNNWGRDL